VTVQVDGSYAINGRDRIEPGVFGVTAYSGANLPMEPQADAIFGETAIHTLGVPGVIPWVSPERMPVDGTEGIIRWYASPEALQNLSDRSYRHGYPYAYILPEAYRRQLEVMTYLYGVPGWLIGPGNVPGDFDAYAALTLGYVRPLKSVQPQLRDFHLLNEPNTYWFNGNKFGQHYADLFNRVARRLKDEFPDIRLGGPVLFCPPTGITTETGTFPADTWETWSRPVIDGTLGNLDFFDFHIYSDGSDGSTALLLDSVLAEIDTVTNYSHLRAGAAVPVMITEAGLALTSAEWKDPVRHWQKRTWPWSRLLLSLLDRPDQVLGLQMHELAADIPGEFRLVSLDDLSIRTPTYWLYWLFRHTGGFCLPVTQPGDSPLQVVATRGAAAGPSGGPFAAVVLRNPSDRMQTTQVRFAGGAPAGDLRWDRLFPDEARATVWHDSGAGDMLSIPAKSIAVVYAQVPAADELPAVQTRTDIYGGAVMRPLPGPGGSISVPLDLPEDVSGDNVSVTVRIGMVGNCPGERPFLVVNGQSFVLQGGVYEQNLTIPQILHAGRNQFVLGLSETDGKHSVWLASAAVQVERRRRPLTAGT
jgi:hypothetical protein